MDEEIKIGEMTEQDDSIVVDEDYTKLEGKGVTVDDDSNNITNIDEIYKEALEIKESLDDIREQIKDKFLKILDEGKITNADSSIIELLYDQYNEDFNRLKTLVNYSNSEASSSVGTSTNNKYSNQSLLDTIEDFGFNDAGDLVITINGVTKTFSPKAE